MRIQSTVDDRGRGNFTMEFSHYEEVPPHLAERIIAEAAREREE